MDNWLNHSTEKSIVIVGGGASATLLFAQLSKQLTTQQSNSLTIYIIEGNDALNAGIAYNINHPSFILNVIASRMGAFPEKPDDFYRWLCDFPHLWRSLHNDFFSINYGPDDFVPRMIYAEYLRWIFNEAEKIVIQKNVNIHKIFEQVTYVKPILNSTEIEVITDNKTILFTNTVVFSTGNANPNHQIENNNTVFSSPYCQSFLQQNWTNIKDVLIVGSGLSMVDAVQFLQQQNYVGNIKIISRNALIPLPHADSHQSSVIFSAEKLFTARKVLHAIRNLINSNTSKGICWQDSINSLRPYTNSLWLTLSATERKKLTRLRPWWNIVRHRIPMASYELLMDLKQKGKLITLKGEIKNRETNNSSCLLELNDCTTPITAEKIIICSGYAYGYPYLQSLCDDLLDTATLQQLFNVAKPDFKISSTHAIYALGPALSEVLWETTAIHEIRQQSEAISHSIVDALAT